MGEPLSEDSICLSWQTVCMGWGGTSRASQCQGSLSRQLLPNAFLEHMAEGLHRAIAANLETQQNIPHVLVWVIVDSLHSERRSQTPRKKTSERGEGRKEGEEPMWNPFHLGNLVKKDTRKTLSALLLCSSPWTHHRNSAIWQYIFTNKLAVNWFLVLSQGQSGLTCNHLW